MLVQRMLRAARLDRDVYYELDRDRGANGQSFLVQWQHGQTVPVFPASVAVAKPEYPKPNWQ